MLNCGSASQAPHHWKSTSEVLANNYLPAEKTWKERPENQGKRWPSEKLSALDEAVKLLKDDGPFCGLLKKPEPGGPGRAGFADFCIAIVCDQRFVKDWKGFFSGSATIFPFFPRMDKTVFQRMVAPGRGGLFQTEFFPRKSLSRWIADRMGCRASFWWRNRCGRT